MKLRTHTAIAIGLILAMAQSGAAQTGAEAEASAPSSTEFPTPGIDDPIANEGIVEDNAIDALRQMSEFLMSAKTMEITSQSSTDVVTENGQRIQLDGTTHYKVRKPNGFVIDYSSDIKSRRFLYDGTNFTVYSPTLGFYATVPAPPTSREVLEKIYENFGIALPLEDLLRWADESSADRIQELMSAYEVGPATIDGVLTTHYAFREEEVDWELWIQQGERSFPRKLVIVDRTDPAMPTFTARLTWSMNPVLADADFTFVPGPEAKQIQLATYQGTGE